MTDLELYLLYVPGDLRGESEGQRGGDDEDQGVQAARQRDVQQEAFKVGLKKIPTLTRNPCHHPSDYVSDIVTLSGNIKCVTVTISIVTITYRIS